MRNPLPDTIWSVPLQIITSHDRAYAGIIINTERTMQATANAYEQAHRVSVTSLMSRGTCRVCQTLGSGIFLSDQRCQMVSMSSLPHRNSESSLGR